MCGHELRIFERAAGVHVGRDPGGPKCGSCPLLVI
jgi:hypothetical protein